MVDGELLHAEGNGTVVWCVFPGEVQEVLEWAYEGHGHLVVEVLVAMLLRRVLCSGGTQVKLRRPLEPGGGAAPYALMGMDYSGKVTPTGKLDYMLGFSMLDATTQPTNVTVVQSWKRRRITPILIPRPGILRQCDVLFNRDDQGVFRKVWHCVDPRPNIQPPRWWCALSSNKLKGIAGGS